VGWAVNEKNERLFMWQISGNKSARKLLPQTKYSSSLTNQK